MVSTRRISRMFKRQPTLYPPLLVSQVLEERVGVLLPLAGLNVGQFLHLAANKIPELLNAVLHPPPQLLLSGPGACRERGGGVKEKSLQQKHNKDESTAVIFDAQV